MALPTAIKGAQRSPSKYVFTFSPETLDTLQRPYDEACEAMRTTRIDAADEQTTRELVAKRIIEAASERGERDPAELCRRALAVFD